MIMQKFSLILFLITCLTVACTSHQNQGPIRDPQQSQLISDSLAQVLDWPEGLELSWFAGPDITPSPACLAVAPTGEVFVGVDMMGSLGKEPGKGMIVKLIDTNHDGVSDTSVVFTTVNNPRGILPIGDQVFVLHTVFSEESGIASGMDLVVFEDANQDGVADGPPKPLIQHVSSPRFLQDRGTDHSTNGIRMGIDGWIYIAVGDFGFHNATDRSGQKLTQLGGGILRVRPDGTEMEVYTHGLRNIYDVAIDPFMNIFTRGNTNDGGGWNIRFIHQIQSGEYGYPVLFKHFTDEIIPALIDVGGGSGTGALFMDDPHWPAAFNQVPMMADWGRNELFIHRVKPDGASFTQQEEAFIELPQITDLDIDASGQLFLSAWDGAGYRGDSSKGFVVRAIPADWEYEAFPDLHKASVNQLVKLLQSASAVSRLHAQQELLTRPAEKASAAVWKIAADTDLPLEVRVAGIFTFAQLAQADGIDKLVGLCTDKAVQEFALRALTDRKGWLADVPMEPFLTALESESERIQIAAMVGLGRLGRIEAASHLLGATIPAGTFSPATGTEGLHSTPNAALIPAHIAVRSLVRLHAVDACVAAIGTDQGDLALWALRYMHDEKAVEGLIAAFEASSPELQTKILTTLSRLYKQEAAYDGSWWWSTRPDTHGPYYKGITWESSDRIAAFLTDQWKQTPKAEQAFFADLNRKHRMGIKAFGGEQELIAEAKNTTQLGRISNKKGQISKSSIEDIMLAIAEIEGDPKVGEQLFTQQGCVACHSLRQGEPMKGPYMGQIGSIMSRDQIAESILKPNASISQGFASVLITAKGNKSYAGFVSEESSERLVIRNIVGDVFTVNSADILSRTELETSMMPLGLANSLSFEEFASLVTFLSERKK